MPSRLVPLIVIQSILVQPAAVADTPLGWINSSNSSAYTTTRGDLEISLAGLAVNDTLDVLNIRDDLLAGNRRLVGDSGDLNGNKLELNYGLFEPLSVFYRRQSQDLRVDLGEISSINLIDIDDALDTTAESAGFKWTFYRANLLNPNNRFTSASLELSAFRNRSDPFDVVLDEMRINNLTLFFRDPQTFSVTELEDDGWKARILYTWPMESLGTGTIWTGFGESSASSATTSDLTVVSIARAFEQQFEIEEQYFYLGASLNFNISPRIPINISYEYINIHSSDFERFPETPLIELPGFLAGNQSSEDTNHVVNARISYWLTPTLNISLTGNLFSNQFLGVLPHYNNPLSGSFADKPYGYAGLELNYSLRAQ